jgi:hypothetical protein
VFFGPSWPKPGLSDGPAPFATPQDILLAKLHWFQEGGQASAVQWRGIQGIVRSCHATLDRDYLQVNASSLGLLS